MRSSRTSCEDLLASRPIGLKPGCINSLLDRCFASQAILGDKFVDDPSDFAVLRLDGKHYLQLPLDAPRRLLALFGPRAASFEIGVGEWAPS